MPEPMLDNYVEQVLGGAIKLLPLSRTPVNSWDDSSDLLRFLSALYPETSPGSAARSYAGIVKGLFAEEILSASQLADLFAKSVDENLTYFGFPELEVTPDFRNDEAFGFFAKHWAAWRAFKSAMLEESLFYSLPHFLEADSDLDAAVLLCRSLFYRQSFEMFRNFLEDVVLPIHFADDPSAYGRWKAGDYRTPSFGGADGLLAKLRDSGLIPESLRSEIGSAYRRLNGNVHSTEANLNYSGLYTGRSNGQFFKSAVFHEWCDVFASLVRFAMQLHLINTRQLGALREANAVLCDVCHNTDPVRFAVTKEEFGGSALLRHKCLICGNTLLMRAP